MYRIFNILTLAVDIFCQGWCTSENIKRQLCHTSGINSYTMSKKSELSVNYIFFLWLVVCLVVCNFLKGERCEQ